MPMRVKTERQHGQKGFMQFKTDEQIKQAVEDEMRWDSRIVETEIGVTVHNSVVTLTGEVNSYAKKIAAQEAAHRVVDVLDVANDVKIIVPDALERTDTEIAQAVRRALQWDVLVVANKIHTTVAEGWVTLEGEVDSLAQKNHAERAIESLVGVRGVTNKLSIAPHVRTDDVQQQIELALGRRAAHEAQHIQVSVAQGAVTLSGNVRNYGEKRAIIGAVSHVPGVATVNDELRVNSSV